MNTCPQPTDQPGQRVIQIGVVNPAEIEAGFARFTPEARLVVNAMRARAWYGVDLPMQEHADAIPPVRFCRWPRRQR